MSDENCPSLYQEYKNRARILNKPDINVAVILIKSLNNII